MEIDAVRLSYARWAPFYDHTFGAATNIGRRRAAGYISRRGGSVLEVGVGTGLALEHYDRRLAVTGIDYSDEMLAKARAKVRDRNLTQVKALSQMDARALDFPDASFDTVTAMHVISVVPEPERVMAEMARVTKPGGEVVLTGHFARDKGVLALLERIGAKLHDQLGWHSDFAKARVMGVPALRLIEDRPFPPFGMMSFMVFRKEA
jgi:phosphatidylethanolamine/phosphatidyl-N-methylethanolamine N-methyltransferase